MGKTPQDRAKLQAERKQRMLVYLEKVPLKYREGPWSPVATVVLICFSLFVLWTLPEAVKSYTDFATLDFLSKPQWLSYYHILVGIHGFLLVYFTINGAGDDNSGAGTWILGTYTITTWNLSTCRMLFSFLGQYSPLCQVIANITRFPALVGATNTVAIWWTILVPLISHLLRSNPEKRKFFWDFNFSYMLLNFHGFVLVYDAIDFLVSGEPLQFFDLWMGLLVALVYTCFYLFVLDPAGMQIYVFLTPRTPLCFIPYCSVLGMYYVNYVLWNYALEYWTSM